jgi:hypothetical protein
MHIKRHPHLSSIFKLDHSFLLFDVWAMFLRNSATDINQSLHPRLVFLIIS